MTTTTAKVPDNKEFEKLLHGKEKAFFADKAYANKELKQTCRKKGIYYGITDKATRTKKLSNTQKKKNTKHSRVRAKGEHPFHVIKNLFHYKKARYR